MQNQFLNINLTNDNTFAQMNLELTLDLNKFVKLQIPCS